MTPANAPPAGAPPAGRGVLAASLVTAVALAILVALGVWQLQRKAWKDALISTLEQRLAATAVALPAPVQWATLEADRDEFLRVAFTAQFQNDKEAFVYTSGSSMRSDTSGPGYWVFTPARLGDGSIVVVNRGFVPEGRQNQATRRDGAVCYSMMGALFGSPTGVGVGAGGGQDGGAVRSPPEAAGAAGALSTGMMVTVPGRTRCVAPAASVISTDQAGPASGALACGR